MANTYSLDLELSSSQYAYVADNATLSITGDISIECWVNVETLPSTSGGNGEYMLVGKYNNGANQRSYALTFNVNDKVVFYYSDNGEYTSHATVETTDSAAITSGNVGNWVHIAVTADVSAKDVKIYKNGVLLASTASPSDATSIYDGTADFTIGAKKNNVTWESFMDGKIGDVRVWNDVRTITEINDNMFLQLNGDETGLVGYWRLNNDYLDQTSNNNDLTAVASPVFSESVPNFTAEELYETPLFGNTDLVSYYRFEGDSTDAKGSNDGTDTAITYGVSYGRFNQGSLYNGSTSVIVLPVNTLKQNVFTWSCWFNTSKTSSWGTLMDNGQAVTVGYAELRVANTNYLQANISGATSGVKSRNSSTIVTDGSWHMATVTWDGTDLLLYLDGSLQSSGSDTDTGTITGDLYRSTGKSTIGALWNNSGSSYLNYFTGNIDDVATFDIALTATQINDLYLGNYGNPGAFFQFL